MKSSATLILFAESHQVAQMFHSVPVVFFIECLCRDLLRHGETAATKVADVSKNAVKTPIFPLDSRNSMLLWFAATPIYSLGASSELRLMSLCTMFPSNWKSTKNHRACTEEKAETQLVLDRNKITKSCVEQKYSVQSDAGKTYGGFLSHRGTPKSS